MENVSAEAVPKPKSKFWKILIGVFVFFLVVSLFSDDDSTSSNNSVSQNSETSQPAQEVKSEAVAKAPEVIPEPSVIELSGSGQQASKTFKLERGLSVFRLTHTGTSNFAVNLLDSDGQNVELLVNEIGKFDGAKAVGIVSSGEYVLDISASGKWTVKIEQPRPVSADQKPQTFTGIGQQVSPFISLNKGLTTFKLKHEGSSNFAVVLMDKDGNREELLVNEIGKFDGSKAIGISGQSLYLMDISADGKWSISAE